MRWRVGAKSMAPGRPYAQGAAEVFWELLLTSMLSGLLRPFAEGEGLCAPLSMAHGTRASQTPQAVEAGKGWAASCRGAGLR